MSSFTQTIPTIQDGTAVSAANTNPPLLALQNNCLYLYQVLQALGASQALYIQNASVNPTAMVGQVLYYNTSAGYFDLALAAGGLPQNVVGLLLNKSSAGVGTIITSGFAALSLANALPSGTSLPAIAGQYFLSPYTAGSLSTAPSAVLVCISDGTGNLFVLPQNYNLEPAQPYALTGGGTTTNAAATAVTVNGPNGILGTVCIQNTGSTNGLTWTVTVNDQFGHTGSTGTGNVAASSSQILTMGSTAYGAALPPYTSFSLAVQAENAGNQTTYSLKGAVMY
jgi:hypothetical protein